MRPQPGRIGQRHYPEQKTEIEQAEDMVALVVEPPAIMPLVDIRRTSRRMRIWSPLAAIFDRFNRLFSGLCLRRPVSGHGAGRQPARVEIGRTPVIQAPKQLVELGDDFSQMIAYSLV